MAQKPRSSADELLERLRASLDEEVDNSPEEVFAGQSSTAFAKDADGGEDDFDANMARLLGSLVAEHAEKNAPAVSNQGEKDPAIPPEDEEMTDFEDTDDEVTEAEDDGDVPLTPLDGSVPEQTVPAEVTEMTDAEMPPCERVEVEIDKRQESTDPSTPQDAASPESASATEVIAGNPPLPQAAEQQPDLPDREENTPRTEGEVLPSEVLAAAKVEDVVSPTPDRENEIVLDEYEEATPVSVPSARANVCRTGVTGNGGTVPQESAGEMRSADGAGRAVPVGGTPETAPKAPAGTVQTEAEDKPKAVPVTPVSSPLDAIRRANAEKQEKKTHQKQSPLDALSRAGGNIAGNVTTMDGSPLSRPMGGSAKRERTLSDEDVELLLDLGYENNLAQKIGNERVESVKYRRRDDEKRRRLLRAVYGCRGEEYGGHAQNKQIREDYQRSTRNAAWRVAVEIFLTLLLLVVDLYALFHDSLPQAVMPRIDACIYPIGFLLLVVAAIPSWKILIQGGRSLLRLEPNPASASALGYFLTLAYDVLLLLSDGGVRNVWLNATAGLSLVLLAVGELMTVRRERISFEVVAARSRKIVVEHVEPKKKKVVRGGHIVKIINDNAGEKLLRVRPTDTVAGYFRRTGEPTPRYHRLGVLISLALLLGGVAAGVTIVRWGDGIGAATSFVLTVQVAMPMAVLVGYALPMLKAAVKLKDHGCALIGQSAIDEYAGKKTLLFDDTEMFRAKSSTEITVKGSGDPRRYIRYAKRLFHTLGGTLRGVATSDLSEETYAERVEILKIADEGVEARIDGKVHVIAGNSAYLLKNGIAVPGENAELLVRRNVESCILYLAFDGKLRLGYEIDYRISGRFEQIVERFAALDTAVAVCSCDPNINPDFLSRSRSPEQTPVGVIKPIRFERQAESHLIDSGVVATRSARDIYYALAACDHLLNNDRQIRFFYGVSLTLGAILSIVLAFAGWIIPGISAIALLLQLEWCIPVGLLTRRNLSYALGENKATGGTPER